MNQGLLKWKAAALNKNNNFDPVRKLLLVRAKSRNGKKCTRFCFHRKQRSPRLVSCLLTFDILASNISLVYEENDGDCCQHALHKFKHYVLTELPKQIRPVVETCQSTYTLIERIQHRSQHTKFVDVVVGQARQLMDKYLSDPLPIS